MNSGPIVLSEDGSKIFWAHEAWHDHCANNNIPDPWRLEQKIKDEYIHHYETIDEHGMKIGHIDWDEPTDDQKQRLKECHEYRDKYMEDRELWEGKYILKNFGYNVLSKFAQAHSSSETALSCDRAFHIWYRKVKPCEGKNGQCNFSCPVFNNCPYQEQGI